MGTLQGLFGGCVLWMTVCGVWGNAEFNTEDNTIQDDISRMVGPGDGKMGAPQAKSLYPAPVCNLQPSFANYCHSRGAGLYTYTADYNCFVQCDEWGKTFIKPCAFGTYWKPDGYEPTLYNRCVGRHPVVASSYKNLQTTHVRSTQQYTDPATGQNVVHTSGQRLTSYGRKGFQPTPTPLPTRPLHKNDLVNMYINGKPGLNRYVYGKSGTNNPQGSQTSPQYNQPRIHHIAPPASPQPQMQPRQPVAQVQQLPQQHFLPQTQVYNPAHPPAPVQVQPIQMNRPPPPQALAQKLQLPSMLMQTQVQPQPLTMIQPIQIKPIKSSLPSLSRPQNQFPPRQQPQQQRQQPQQPQRITLNSRFPLVANKGQGQLNLPKINTNNMMSNGSPVPRKQFNLQKQRLLAKNFHLPGLTSRNNIANNNPTMIRRPGLLKKNLQLQKKRGQSAGRPNLRKLINMRRQKGNQKSMANARLVAERRRRLQQWRQFMKNKKQGGQRHLNGQGGDDRSLITTAVLNDQYLGGEMSDGEDLQDNMGIAKGDDGIIKLDALFGEAEAENDVIMPSEDVYDNFVDRMPLFDFTGNNDDTGPAMNNEVNVDISNGSATHSTDEVIGGTEGLRNTDDNVVVSNDSSEVNAAELEANAAELEANAAELEANAYEKNIPK